MLLGLDRPSRASISVQIASPVLFSLLELRQLFVAKSPVEESVQKIGVQAQRSIQFRKTPREYLDGRRGLVAKLEFSPPLLFQPPFLQKSSSEVAMEFGIRIGHLDRCFEVRNCRVKLPFGEVELTKRMF